MTRTGQGRRRARRSGGVIAILISVIGILLTLTVGIGVNRYLSRRAALASYPRHYRDIVEEQAEAYDLPQGLVYAMIRTESSFDPEATSGVGARGLMQLMPSTYEWIAWRLGEEADPSRITEPAINIRYGCYLLSYFRDKYGDFDLVIAAYNAGDGNVDKWLKDDRYSENGILKTIPFPETENHVKKVNRAWERYLELYNIEETTREP